MSVNNIGPQAPATQAQSSGTTEPAVAQWSAVNHVESVIDAEVKKAGDAAELPAESLAHIIQEMIDSIGEDALARAHVDAFLNRVRVMPYSGQLTTEQAQTFSKQIQEGIDSAVGDRQLRLQGQADQWQEFSADTGVDETMRKMAQDVASRNRWNVFWGEGHGGDRQARRFDGLINEAKKDGEITLQEINGMYQGVYDAFRSGQINSAQRDRSIQALEQAFRNQMHGSHDGSGFGNRFSFNRSLSPEAKEFLNTQIGARWQDGGGWHEGGGGRWMFNQNRLRSFVTRATQDGAISPAERTAMLNIMFRDGKVTQFELNATFGALQGAVNAGHISQQEHDQTKGLLEAELAKYLPGSQTVGQMQQNLQIQSGIIRG